MQSPRPHTLRCLTCLKAYLSTSKYPAESARPESAIYLWALMGGTKWRKSKFFSIFSLVCRFSKMALLPLISIKFVLKEHLILYSAAIFTKDWAYFWTPNITPGALRYYTSALMPADLHLSVKRYKIFWGAPAHLIGGTG